MAKIGEIKTIDGVNYICKGFTESGKPKWRKDVKIEKAKHNVGDTHPTKPWVWTEYKPGKFDWRPDKKSDNNQQKNTGSSNNQPVSNQPQTNQVNQKQPVNQDTPSNAQPKKDIKDMTPSELVDYANSASTSALENAVNDKNADKGFRQIAFNVLKQRDDYDKSKVNSGDLDGGYIPKPKAKIQYKTKKPNVDIPEPKDFSVPSATGEQKLQKISVLRKNYAKRSDDELLKTLNNRNARWQFRQLAYEEALARGIDESKINVKGSLANKWKEYEDIEESKKKMNKEYNEEEGIELFYDWQGKEPKELLAQFDNGYDPAWLNPNSEKVQKVFDMSSLSGRQLYDTFKDYYQRNPDLVPGYLNATNKVRDLYFRMTTWAKADEAPMFVSAGGAGAGKTYGWQEIVGKYLSLKPLKPGDDPAQTDWSYVILGDDDAEDDKSFRRALAKYNGSWIDDEGNERPHILFFDDGDKILTSRASAMRNLMKKINDNKAENRIFTNPDTGEKEVWKGKIIITTNKDLSKLAAANEDFKAIQSRITVNDIQFTRNETMELVADRYMDMGLLSEAKAAMKGWTDEEKEDFRQEVYDYMVENISKADPATFTPRTYLQLCNHIAPLWKSGSNVIKTANGVIGANISWRKTALSVLRKAEENEIEKSDDNDMYSKEEMVKHKDDLEKFMNETKKDGTYNDLFGKKAINDFLFGYLDSADDKKSKNTKKSKNKKAGVKNSDDNNTDKAFFNDLTLEEAEDILFS